jgi:CRISPR/Cas system CSM-associated protein Csm2 small subunit
LVSVTLPNLPRLNHRSSPGLFEGSGTLAVNDGLSLLMKYNLEVKMSLLSPKKHKDEDDDFPYEDDEDFDDDNDDEETEETEEEQEGKHEGEETEDLRELEQIESKLAKGEVVAISALESKMISKSETIYSCPRCKKIHFNKKWVKDIITDFYTVHTQLAYCPKCIGKTYENFIGSIEIFDKKLKERKERFKEIAQQVQRALEDAPSFEIIINITERNGILFIFTNTTRLAVEIGKFIRQEFSGGIQYEWFERNQYLRIKWYDMVDNKAYFKERLRSLKDRRFGMFSFEDES